MTACVPDDRFDWQQHDRDTRSAQDTGAACETQRTPMAPPEGWSRARRRLPGTQEHHPPRGRIGASIIGACVAILPMRVFAHAEAGSTVDWWSWNAAPSVALPLIVVGLWYGRGAGVRRGRRSAHEPLLVAAGLVTVAVALLSPVDPLGERSYTMHQVQHLLLRSVAPLLLFVASPAATFVAGAPRALRRLGGGLGGPGPLRVVLHGILHPVTVTALFIAAAWTWQWPPYFTAALRDEVVHDWMHFTMLGSGLLFWWRVFDDRPSAPGYGQRVVMLWAATVANIVLGAILTLKGGVIYPVYAELGRYWLSGVTDEVLGGLVVWIPGSQMALIGLLLVIHRWGRRESRRASTHPEGTRGRTGARGATGETAATPAVGAAIRRQALGLGLLSVTVVLIFGGWIAWALIARP
ncbi:MAG: cytochrome c oxidase assembly protein [Halofilum sp. (in: g-proteobacteria)]|nr:cytochrome c oxidase assembly protein [Halofilum sp. (in: g-proteobacteria)]